MSQTDNEQHTEAGTASTEAPKRRRHRGRGRKNSTAPTAAENQTPPEGTQTSGDTDTQAPKQAPQDASGANPETPKRRRDRGSRRKDSADAPAAQKQSTPGDAGRKSSASQRPNNGRKDGERKANADNSRRSSNNRNRSPRRWDSDSDDTRRTSASASRRCLNCGHGTEDLYCSNCGQKNDTGRLKWVSLFDGFLSSFIGDGAIGDKRSNIRYGFLQTLWATIVHPGKTVSEYLDGHRRKYFNPVTILLLLSAFYGLVGVFFGIVDDTPKPSDMLVTQYFNILYAYSQSHPALWQLILLPFLALAYKWIFRKRAQLGFIEYAYIGIFGAILSVVLNIIRLPFESEALAEYGGYLSWVIVAARGWFAVSVFRALFSVSVRRAIWYWVLSLVVAYTLFGLALIVLLTVVLGIAYLVSPERVGFFLDKMNGTAYGPMQETAKGVSDALRGADSLRIK